jgi:hypothetical protein
MKTMKTFITGIFFRRSLYGLIAAALCFAACEQAASPDGDPPQPGPAPEALAGTWEWNGINLAFTDGENAALGGVPYAYVFTAENGEGNVSALGDFTTDNGKLTFPNYKDRGFSVVFTQVPVNELCGTYWAWGSALLQFPNAKTLKLRDKSYPYSYDEATRTGTALAGEPQQDGLSAISLGVRGLGDFTVDLDEKTITFSDYKGQGAAASQPPFVITFQGQDTDAVPAAVTETLVGTEWGLGQWEIFVDEDTAYNRSSTTFFINGYTYTPATKSGNIEFVNGFEIQSDDTVLHFLSFKNYAHTMDFGRVE